MVVPCMLARSIPAVSGRPVLRGSSLVAHGDTTRGHENGTGARRQNPPNERRRCAGPEKAVTTRGPNGHALECALPVLQPPPTSFPAPRAGRYGARTRIRTPRRPSGAVARPSGLPRRPRDQAPRRIRPPLAEALPDRWTGYLYSSSNRSNSAPSSRSFCWSNIFWAAGRTSRSSSCMWCSLSCFSFAR